MNPLPKGQRLSQFYVGGIKEGWQRKEESGSKDESKASHVELTEFFKVTGAGELASWIFIFKER